MLEDIFDTDEIQVQVNIPENVTVNEYGSTVEVGTVTTLNYGENATVTNTGTADHAILNFGIPRGSSGAAWGILEGNIEDQTDLWTILTGLRTDVDAKAPAASAALTGTPTAPTAIDGTNTDQIATTKFVQNAINLLTSYVNNLVANMLKIMDFANKVNFSIQTQEASYTVPSNGYVIFTKLAYSGTGDSTVKIDGVKMTDGIQGTVSALKTFYPFPIKSGSVITGKGPGDTGNPYIIGIFVPFAS